MNQLKLKSEELKAMGRKKGVKNIHQVSINGRLTYATINRYFNYPEQIGAIRLETLYGVLSDGLLMTPDEVANLKIGDILEVNT